MSKKLISKVIGWTPTAILARPVLSGQRRPGTAGHAGELAWPILLRARQPWSISSRATGLDGLGSGQARVGKVSANLFLLFALELQMQCSIIFSMLVLLPKCSSHAYAIFYHQHSATFHCYRLSPKFHCDLSHRFLPRYIHTYADSDFY